MDGHGLTGWTLAFGEARKRLGACHFRHHVIWISRTHALEGSKEQIRDTVLHEVAHAIAGHEAGHGPLWKAAARRIGACQASRLLLPPEILTLDLDRFKGGRSTGPHVRSELRSRSPAPTRPAGGHVAGTPIHVHGPGQSHDRNARAIRAQSGCSWRWAAERHGDVGRPEALQPVYAGF